MLGASEDGCGFVLIRVILNQYMLAEHALVALKSPGFVSHLRSLDHQKRLVN
jgi:hypothetical protein